MYQEIIRRKLDLLAKTVSKYIDVIIEMRLIMCFHLTGGCIIVYSISTCVGSIAFSKNDSKL